MTEATEIAKVSVKGGFHFLWGLVVSTVISALGTIYIANLLSADEMGLYGLAIAAPTLIGVFRDWGINAALVRYTAKYNSENLVYRAKSIIVSSLFFEIVAGLLLSAISLLLAGFFADLYQLPTITPLIQIASFTILMNAFLTVAQAAFIGFERMKLNSITLIFQSITKALVSPVLVIAGLGVFGAVMGVTLSFIIGGITGTALLWILYRSISPSPSQSKPANPLQSEQRRREITADIKILLKYGVPLSVATILSAFQSQFFTMLMGVYVPVDAVGNYTVAASFVILINFFATPATTMLFPAFSKLDPEKHHNTLQNVYKFSIKYASLLVVPMAFLVIAVSETAVGTLFGNKYPSAPLYLSLLALIYVYTAFGNLSNENLLVSQGKTAFSMKMRILSFAIALPLSFFLVTQFGVVGILITILTSEIPSFIMKLQWININYKLKVDWASSIKILLSSFLASIAALGIQRFLPFSNWINLVISAATFALVFVPSILLTRTIDQYDIDNLKQMATSLGPINRIVNPILNLLKTLLTLTGATG